MMIALYNDTANRISKLVTNKYSTSFSLGIKAFHPSIRPHIYAIYAFARYADEVVDTLLDKTVSERKQLLDSYKNATFEAITLGGSPFPVLHSFQQTVNQFKIDHELIHAFFHSMEMDLYRNGHEQDSFNEYIYGSAEVIGLMCLSVFVDGDDREYDKLKEPASRLGAAFQKVNFLRDIKSDFEERGRVYFPQINFNGFNGEEKQLIEQDIEQDFEIAYQGIKQLPKEARLGVLLAYKYYRALFAKIMKTAPTTIKAKRTRIPDWIKFYILCKTLVRRVVNVY